MSHSQQSIKLSQEQQEIINSDPEQHMKIIACAGSGKTTTIIHRVNHLIKIGQNPSKIIISTFNVPASAEIQKRADEVLDKQAASQILIANIDKIAYKFINQYYNNVGNLSFQEYCPKLLELLRSDKGNDIASQYKYFFFDEFQDVNDIQYQILLEFYKRSCIVIVVGDDAQCIYSFRGSQIDIIRDRIHQDIPGIDIKMLTTNYRCTGEIVNLANKVVLNSKFLIPKKMIAYNKSFGIKPNLSSFYGVKDTNIAVIEYIIYLLYDRNVPRSQIAILSYSNQPLKFIEEAISKHNLSDDIKKIEYAAEISSGDQDQNFDQFSVKNKVVLSTIHKSKGLEWDYVILLGCNDELFRDKERPSDIKSIEEYRRYFYVAITRARKQIEMCMTSNGKYKLATRFLSEACQGDDFTNKGYFTINCNRTGHIISKNNLTQQNFIINSIEEAQQYTYDISVTQIIKHINHLHYQELRQSEILADFVIATEKVHEKFCYNDYIKENRFYMDFGNFIDRVLSRQIAEAFPKQASVENQFNDQYADHVLREYKFEDDIYQYILYKYSNDIQFSNLLKSIQIYQDQKKSVQYILEYIDNKLAHIDQIEKSILVQMLKDLLLFSYRESIKFDQIIPVREKTLPDDVERNIYIGSYLQYRKLELKSIDILKDIYNISMLSTALDKRKRLFYIPDVYDQFTSKEYLQMINNATQYLINEIRKSNPDLILLKQTLQNSITEIQGEPDLVVNDTIYDIKCSSSRNFAPEWKLQLLSYAALMKYTHPHTKINKIAIYNPLLGKLMTIDISQWNKHDELLRQLENIRKSHPIFARDHKLSIKRISKIDSVQLCLNQDTIDKNKEMQSLIAQTKIDVEDDDDDDEGQEKIIKKIKV